MTMRTREWLREFLRLDARADKEGIPLTDIYRQEDTVIRTLNMLDDRPGIVLADEVGMGKTYEALGVAAAFHHMNRRSKIVIVTPGPDLNTKWHAEFMRFREMYDFRKDVKESYTLSKFIEDIRKFPIVIAPVTMFQTGRGSGDQTYLLSLYFYWKGLHGLTANAIMARYREGEHVRINVKTEKFLGIFSLEQLEPHLRVAFKRGKTGQVAGLDDLYVNNGYAAFKNATAVNAALYHARFILTGKLMPVIDLLIVDEAHKLKNPGSLRTRAMRQVFASKFRKALFLTATPFQLDVGELKEVFSLFADAKTAPRDLMEQIEALLGSVADYQRHYEEFQQTWASLDPVVAATFRSLYDSGTEKLFNLDDPTLKKLARQVTSLKNLKLEVIEPGFRKWMIRSLRVDKRVYRKHLPDKIQSKGANALPFLIYERFIAELFRRGRQTHKAAVEINMVSSYAAASQGAILSPAEEMPPEAAGYRNLLLEMLGLLGKDRIEHPKVSKVIVEALDAADRDEKTLIFCSRVATLDQLRREFDEIWETRILERWRRVYPDADITNIFNTREGDAKIQRGRHTLLQERLHRPQDLLYLALREPYLRTFVPIAEWSLARVPEVLAESNRILLDVRTGKTAADRLEYRIAKRCVEAAAVGLWRKAHPNDTVHDATLEPFLHPDYIQFGLDMVMDEHESDASGNVQPRWHITERVVHLVIGTQGTLWENQTDLLKHLPVELRDRLVEQLTRYLTYKQVTFLADLLGEASKSGLSMEPIESAVLLDFMPQFWQTAVGQHWMNRLRSFLSYFLERDSSQQLEILEGPIKTGDFARHTKEGESRERLREAFNTPLYPMILVANAVMQEGLDLHKHCRRVVHHDLEWNPAQIEQRVGRIDRLGSLVSRLRKDDNEVTLDILYPLIQGTIDERLYKTVKSREKWLEFLLGAVPNFSEYNFSDHEPPPLPDRLGPDLSIDLGPERH